MGAQPPVRTEPKLKTPNPTWKAPRGLELEAGDDDDLWVQVYDEHAKGLIHTQKPTLLGAARINRLQPSLVDRRSFRSWRGAARHSTRDFFDTTSSTRVEETKDIRPVQF